MSLQRSRPSTRSQGVPIRMQDGRPYDRQIESIVTTLMSGSGSELPVESVLATASSTNPGVGLGYGTWVLYAIGRGSSGNPIALELI